ncbi:MAG: tetratricopeptide repeat protein [Phycisphaerales bacterium]|nr:tetratricopeptide repeat protein [Phycisphaerales bacterium]
MRFSQGVTGLLVGAGLMLAVVGCGSTEKYDVTISYVLEPTQSLPQGLTTVAVIDSEVKTDGTEDTDRIQKWSKISADMIEQMIDEAAKKHGSPLTVAKRRETSKIMAEKDMVAAGLVSGNQAQAAAQLLNVQALITSDLNIRTEVKASKKTSYQMSHLYGYGGWRRGGGGGGTTSEELDAIARNITLQPKYAMVDLSGQAILDYAPKPFRKLDSKKPSGFYGRSSGEADLDPVDHYIGELVEQGTREFVSMFVPCEVEYSYELRSSRNEDSASGILALRADDYDSAKQFFRSALANDPKDHRSAFCLGVTSELTGDWDAALKYYRQAAAMPGLDDDEVRMYVAAKDRVTEHKDRIRKSN